MNIISMPPEQPAFLMRRLLQENSVDGIVTSADIVVPPDEAAQCLNAWVHGRSAFSDLPGPDLWREAYRVLKPGAHAVIMANTPCMDVISMAVRLSGFQIRDGIAFVHDGPTDPSPGWGTIILARKPIEGTVADNMLRYGTGGLNIDATRIPTTDKLGGGAEKDVQSMKPEGWDRPWRHDPEAAKAHAERIKANVAKAEALGRFPANLIHDGSASVMDAFGRFGEKKSGVPGVRRKAHETHSMSGRLAMTGAQETGYADSGSVARFFFNVERSTVNLLRYLISMVIPPGGVLLDPLGTPMIREALASLDISKAILMRESL